MFRRKQKTQTNNVNFLPKKNKLNLLKLSGTLVIVIAVVAAAFIFSKKEKKAIVSSAQVITPTVSASSSILPDWWLKQYFGASVCSQDNCQPDADPDGDKLTNAQEFYYHTNPLKKDTNGNGLSDGEDVAQGFDPSKPGKVSFDTAASDDSIVGESLVFDKDIQQMFSQQISPDSVTIPQPDSGLVKVSNDSSSQAIKAYLSASDAITKKYFPTNADTFIENASESQNPALIEEITTDSSNTIADLSKLSVPPPAVQLQKYLLTFYQLLPEVLNVPTQAQAESMTDTQAGIWYDQTEAFLVLPQKIDTEKTKISKL